MAPKRKHASSSVADNQPRHNRDHGNAVAGESAGGDDKASGGAFGNVSAPLDPEYGQRGAFPDVEGGGDGLFYGPADDGMQYLRMVRSEAKSVPKLLTTAGTRSSAHGTQTHAAGEGHYEDGAYFAANTNRNAAAYSESASESDSDDDDVQAAYYHALRTRFGAFRTQILRAPPTDGQPPSVPLCLRRTAKASQWNYAFRHTAPTLKALAAASQEDVVRGLGRIEGVLEARVVTNAAEVSNVGSWVWTLLAKCADFGAMHSESVGVVRGLGKRALAVAYALRRRGGVVEDEGGGDEGETEEGKGDEKGDEVMQGESDEEGEVVAGESDADELERRKQAVLAKLKGDQADGKGRDDTQDRTARKPEVDREAIDKALGLMDIIVTIVGEAFGQRDLLDARIGW